LCVQLNFICFNQPFKHAETDDRRHLAHFFSSKQRQDKKKKMHDKFGIVFFGCISN